MSNIEVAYHDECIQNILYKEPPPRPKSPMPISERVKYYKYLTSHVKKRHLTMGEAEATLRPPCDFLKKGESNKRVAEKNDHCVRHFNEKKREENKIAQDVLTLKAPSIKNGRMDVDKNHAGEKNKVRQYDRMVIDTVTGHKTKLIESTYIRSNIFGKVPRYIIKKKMGQLREEELYRQELQNQKPICIPISREERQELLDGITYNRNALLKEFLILPMLIDTIPMVNRKAKLESDLRQIENDLFLIENNPYIYIYD